MTAARRSELISRLFDDGGLSPEEERELGLALQESSEMRQLLLSYFRLEGAIVEQARAGLVSTPSPARYPVAPRSLPASRTASLGSWLSGLAAAAAVLLGLLLVLPENRPAPSPAVSSGHLSWTRQTGGSSMPDSTPQASPPSPPIPGKDSPSEASGLLPKDVPAHPRDNVETPIPEPSGQKAPEPPTGGEESHPGETVLADVFLERIEGEVTVVGAGGREPGRAGDSLRAGQDLETGVGKSLAVLSFPDGTRIEVRPETLVRDIRQKGAAPGKTGKSIYLQRGTLWAEVRPQPPDRPLVIVAPRGEARVVGTVFTLRMDADPKGSLRLDVQEGKVHFTRSSDGRSVDVGAGHSVSSGQSAELVVLHSQELVQSFQDGRFPTADYAGTRDTQLVEKSPQTAFGGAKLLLAEAEDPREKRKATWPLLRWDLSSVPVGSRVHSVTVTLHIAEPSRGQMFYFFEPARSWSETEATWKFASSGNLWRFPGSIGAVERWGAPLGTLSPLRKGEYTTVLGETGIALVQSWINFPATNLGLQIASSSPGAGFHFQSREAQAPETRPRLTIVYAPKK
jgi:ferric-dicitrate binding protein FerR (iron transport regulator)